MAGFEPATWVALASWATSAVAFRVDATPPSAIAEIPATRHQAQFSCSSECNYKGHNNYRFYEISARLAGVALSAEKLLTLPHHRVKRPWLWKENLLSVLRGHAMILQVWEKGANIYPIFFAMTRITISRQVDGGLYLIWKTDMITARMNLETLSLTTWKDGMNFRKMDHISAQNMDIP